MNDRHGHSCGALLFGLALAAVMITVTTPSPAIASHNGGVRTDVSEPELSRKDLIDTINLLRGSIHLVQTSGDIHVIEAQEAMLWDQLDTRLITDAEVALAVNDYLRFLNSIVLTHGRKELVHTRYNLKSNEVIASSLETAISDLREQSILGLIAKEGGPLTRAVYLFSSLGVKFVALSAGTWEYKRAERGIENDRDAEVFELEAEHRQSLTEMRIRFNELLGDLVASDRLNAGELDELLIRDDQLRAWSDAVLLEDPAQRYTRLRGLERSLSTYAPYWFHRGMTETLLAANGDDAAEELETSAIDSFSRFDETRARILIRDRMYRSRLILESGLESVFRDPHRLRSLLAKLDQFLFEPNDPTGELAIAMAHLRVGDIVRARERTRQVATADAAAVEMAGRARIAIELAVKAQGDQVDPNNVTLVSVAEDLKRSGGGWEGALLSGWSVSGDPAWLGLLESTLRRVSLSLQRNKLSRLTGERDVVVDIPKRLGGYGLECRVVLGDVDWSVASPWIEPDETASGFRLIVRDMITMEDVKSASVERIRVSLQSAEWSIDLLYRVDEIDGVTEIELFAIERCDQLGWSALRSLTAGQANAYAFHAQPTSREVVSPDERVGWRANVLAKLQHQVSIDAAKRAYMWSKPDEYVYLRIPAALSSCSDTDVSLEHAGQVFPLDSLTEVETISGIDWNAVAASTLDRISSRLPEVTADRLPTESVNDDPQALVAALSAALVEQGAQESGAKMAVTNAVARVLYDAGSGAVEVKFKLPELHDRLRRDPEFVVVVIDHFGREHRIERTLDQAAERVEEE